MIDKDTADKFLAVMHKHAGTVRLDLLIDLTKALRLTLRVSIVEPNEGAARSADDA